MQLIYKMEAFDQSQVRRFYRFNSNMHEQSFSRTLLCSKSNFSLKLHRETLTREKVFFNDNRLNKHSYLNYYTEWSEKIVNAIQ